MPYRNVSPTNRRATTFVLILHIKSASVNAGKVDQLRYSFERLGQGDVDVNGLSLFCESFIEDW